MKLLKKPSWNKGIKAEMSERLKAIIRLEYKKLYLNDKQRRETFCLPLVRKIKGKWITIRGTKDG